MFPTCYFREDLFTSTNSTDLLQRLRDIVQKHRGTIAISADDADHIIYPPSFEESQDSTNNQNHWVRVVRRKSKESLLIHRLFTPDSHDEWLNGVEVDDDAPGLNESGSNASGDIWEVTANWLLDTDAYNEWMNQEDYEVDSEQTQSKQDGKVYLKKPPRARRTLNDILKKVSGKSGSSKQRSPSPNQPNKKPKTNTNTNTLGNRKRKHEEINNKDLNSKENGDSNMDNSDLTKNMDAPPAQPHVEEVQVPKHHQSIKKEGPGGGGGDFQPYRNGTLIDLDEDNNNESEAKESQMNGHHLTNGGGGSYKINGLENGDASSAEACEQTHHIIVPSYSAWFDYTCIHEIEKRALPEFFTVKNKSKTPEIYIGYRNFMIDTYRLNPGEYLSVTACRRNLPGDVCAIMRVHALLEQWGLINYQVDYDARAAPLGPPCTSHFTVLADTPSGLAPITAARPTTGAQAAKQMVDLGSKLNKQPAQASKSNSIEDKESIKENSTASATTAPTVDVEKLNPEEFGLKIEKKQSSVINPIMKSQEWNDQELLLLLEGVEMYRDDWNKVCEHVGTRTQDECILKFLQLPIEDPYLEGGVKGAEESSSKLSSVLGPLAFQPIPFSQSGNPVMSTVAFLASVVDPRVASAAAKAAIGEFTKMKDEVPPQIMDSHINSVVQATKDGKKVDSNYNIEQTGIAIVNEENKDKDNKENSENNNAMEVDQTNSEKKSDEEEKEGKESDASKKDQEQGSGGEQTTTVTLTTTTTTTTTTLQATTTSKSKDSTISNNLTEAEIKTAAASALSAAAVKARQLALNEEKKIKSTVSLLVETQLKKLEIKLRHFEELEAIMDRERENLEHQRQQLLQERQQFHLEQLRSVELKQRTQAANQLISEGKLTIPQIPPQQIQPQQQPLMQSASGTLLNQPSPAPAQIQVQRPSQSATPQAMDQNGRF